MSTSELSPPLVPDLDRAVFIVLDDFGPLGRALREVDEDDADLECTTNSNGGVNSKIGTAVQAAADPSQAGAIRLRAAFGL